MKCLDQSSPFNWVTDSSVRNTRGSSVPTSPISIYGDRYWIIYFLKDHTFSQVPSRIIPLLNNVRNYNYAFCQSPHVLHAFTFTDNVNHFLRYFSLLSVLVLTSGERKRRDPKLSWILDSTYQIPEVVRSGRDARYWNSDSLSVELGFQIPIVSEIPIRPEL